MSRTATIRTAYTTLAPRPGAMVGMAALREQAALTRPDFDAAITDLLDDVFLFEDPCGDMATDADREAAYEGAFVLLAVAPRPIDQPPVDATGTRRRMEALARTGWTREASA